MQVQLTKERPGITLKAIPDSGKIEIKPGKNGAPRYMWRNTLILPDSIHEQLKKTSIYFVYPPENRIDFKGISWIINTCTDADEYRNSLIGIDEDFGRIKNIFNHPRAICMSRRDLSSKLLSGIPNLIVPKCVQFIANDTQSFQRAFEKNSFDFPVIVRPATSQTGEGMLKIDHPLDWPKVYQSHWYMKPHFMTQFVDFKQENGRYLKIRIAVIGDKLSLRAYGEDTQWRLGHAGVREEEVSTSELCKQLIDQYDAFSSWGSANKIGNEIRNRAKLDFFGIDLGVIDRNTFVLFEANAAMTMAEASGLSPEDREILGKIFLNMEKDLLALLSHPEKWSDGKTFPTCRNILEIPSEPTLPYAPFPPH